MKAITVYETADGMRFDRLDHARRHAEARHSQALFEIAGTLHCIAKRSGVAAWIAENMPRFAELQRLADDCEVAESDSED